MILKGKLTRIRSNLFFIGCVAAAVLLTYFVKLTAYTIGYDTDLFMGDKDYIWFNWREIGRFGLIFLKSVFSPQGLNIHMATGMAVFFLIIGALIWCSFLLDFCALFDTDWQAGDKAFPLMMLPAVFFYVTSGVWQEQIYYQLQSAEVMLIVCICPISVMLLIRGIEENSAWLKALFTILTVFMLSVYQAIIMMSVAAILIFLYSRIKKGDGEAYKYLREGAALILLSLIFYFALSYVFKSFVFRVADSGFFSAQVNKGNGVNPLFRLAGYIFMLFFANIKSLSSFADPLIAAHAFTGEAAVDYYHSAFQDIASVLYIPTVLIFVITEIKNTLREYKRRGISAVRSATAVIIILAIPLSVLAFPVAGAGDIKVRVQFVLPLVAMFLFMYVTDFFFRLHLKLKKHSSLLSFSLTVIVIFYAAFMQGERVSMLFMSDLKMFQHDEMLAFDLDSRIENVKLKEKLPADTPVFIEGFYEPGFDPAMTHGEFIGKSAFARNRETAEGTTGHSIAFMRVLGYAQTPCREPDDGDADVINGMAAYPSEACVKYSNGKIIVKLS